MFTPWSPPEYTTLATRTRGNVACRAAMLRCYARLVDQVRTGMAMHRNRGQEPCGKCTRLAAAAARLEAIIAGRETITESWQPAPRERVRA